jgi:hypothetical protein
LGRDNVKAEPSPLKKVRAALSKARGDHDRAIQELGTVTEELRELAHRVERLKSRGGPFREVELSPFAAAALGVDAHSAEAQPAGRDLAPDKSAAAI